MIKKKLKQKTKTFQNNNDFFSFYNSNKKFILTFSVTVDPKTGQIKLTYIEVEDDTK